MCFQCSYAEDRKSDLRFFDVVYLAALVGISDEQKHGMIKSVVERMRPGAMLVLRSARRSNLSPHDFGLSDKIIDCTGRTY